jgi:hypothetical protein
MILRVAFWLISLSVVSGFVSRLPTPTLHSRAILTRAIDKASDGAGVAGAAEALAVWKGWNERAGTSRDDEILARFSALAELVGPESALTIVKNGDGRVIDMEAEKARAYVDAWIARCGNRDEAIDLLRKNPNLIAGELTSNADGSFGSGSYGIDVAPVFAAKAVAEAMDFTRKLFGGGV